MARIGEIWLVDFGKPFPSEPAFHRPALVAGPAALFNERLPIAFVIPMTTTPRGLDLHVEIDATAQTGLSNTSYAQCELLRSVSTHRLTTMLGHAPLAATDEAASTVRLLLDLHE